jgi:NAD(P)H dehydrogenase (quinone)
MAQDAKATFVPKDDSARLAAALLLGRGEDNKAYIACGKETISCHEICRIVNEISGKNFTEARIIGLHSIAP